MTRMPSITFVCGILLVLIGLAGYAYGFSISNPSLTALIPAAFGILFIISAAVAMARENLRMHVMHVAVIVGLLGVVLPMGRILSRMGELTMSAAFLSQAATAFVCLVFVVLAVRSFIAARRNRENPAG